MLDNQNLPAGFISAVMICGSAASGAARVRAYESVKEEPKRSGDAHRPSREDLKDASLADLGICLMWASLSGLI